MNDSLVNPCNYAMDYHKCLDTGYLNRITCYGLSIHMMLHWCNNSWSFRGYDMGIAGEYQVCYICHTLDNIKAWQGFTLDAASDSATPHDDSNESHLPFPMPNTNRANGLNHWTLLNITCKLRTWPLVIYPLFNLSASCEDHRINPHCSPLLHLSRNPLSRNRQSL